MDYLQYIKPALLILIPVLWMIGVTFKKTPKLPDWLIPYLLGMIGIIGSSVWVCATEGISALSLFTSFTQGILVTGASVWGNQLVIQFKKKHE